MHRVRALGLDEETTTQLFAIFDRTMARFGAVREEYGLHDGLRDAVALAIIDILAKGEKNFTAIEHQAERAGGQYMKDRHL